MNPSPSVTRGAEHSWVFTYEERRKLHGKKNLSTHLRRKYCLGNGVYVVVRSDTCTIHKSSAFPALVHVREAEEQQPLSSDTS